MQEQAQVIQMCKPQIFVNKQTSQKTQTEKQRRNYCKALSKFRIFKIIKRRLTNCWRTIHMHFSGLPFPGFLNISFIGHASEYSSIFSCIEISAQYINWLINKHMEEKVQSHLPLSLSPSDGTLQLELSHVCACVSVLKEIGGRVRAGSAGERESRSTCSCTRTRKNQGAAAFHKRHKGCMDMKWISYYGI